MRRALTLVGVVGLVAATAYFWPTSEPTPAADAPAAAFVASVNSEVFHVERCRHAARIKGENRVGYATRDEAVYEGLRPCKVCEP